MLSGQHSDPCALPAFLGGGFCYSASSSRRCTPPAILVSLKYAYSPCVLSSCVAEVDFILIFFFSSFPFSNAIWTSLVFILSFVVCTMLSPRFRFLL